MRARVDLRGRRPILVTGMPRSGTTWVGRMLTASGEVGYINEPLNRTASPGTVRIPVDHWYPYITAENEERLLPRLEETLRFKYHLVQELKQCRNRTDLHHTLKTWAGFVRSRRRRPLVKEPHAVFSVDWFMRRLGSDVVVTVRQPLAVVSSWKRLDWSFDFSHLLEQPALMRDWLAPVEPEMLRALSPSMDLIDRVALLWRVIYSVVADERFPRVHVVRQEDLSRDPVREFAKLYDALGLRFTKAAAEAVAASSSSENPKETRVDKPHETRLDSKANLESWRQRLTGDEISRVVRLTDDTARLYYPGPDAP
jgi:hypothetical protein